MARLTGVGSVTGAMVRELRGNAGVTAIVPGDRILNYVPANTTRPYIRVEVMTETDDDTLALGGVDTICSVVAVSDYHGADEIGRIADAVRNALDGVTLDIAGFMAPADTTYEQALGEFVEDVAGVTVRHRPLWFRVRAL